MTHQWPTRHSIKTLSCCVQCDPLVAHARELSVMGCSLWFENATNIYIFIAWYGTVVSKEGSGGLFLCCVARHHFAADFEIRSLEYVRAFFLLLPNIFAWLIDHDAFTQNRGNKRLFVFSGASHFIFQHRFTRKRWTIALYLSNKQVKCCPWR